MLEIPAVAIDNAIGMANAEDIKPVIGIVGGLGAGKSTVAAELAKLGCVVIDADAIGHELLARPDVQDVIRRRWGSDVFDDGGQVSRPALGEIVFNDPASLADLNAITHPLIGQEITRRIAEAGSSDAPVIVLDAAVLFEAGWNTLCTHTVFIDAPRGERLQRVQQSRGWDEATFSARENAQIDVDKKAGMCDHILSNHAKDSPPVSAIRELLKRMASTSNHP